MKVIILIIYFLCGIAIGIISSVITFYVSFDKPHESFKVSKPETSSIQNVVQLFCNKSKSNVSNAPKKIRILCMLNTRPANHYRAVHIQQLWGKHCDKLVYASTITDVILGTIGFNVTDEHDYVWAKQKRMMIYIYTNFLNHFDWFYKADDDSFAIMENLRYLLSSYSNEDPIIFGYKFNTTEHRWGYFSGGAGNLLIVF